MAGLQLKPLSMRREGDGLLIAWNDGVRTFATWKSLRDRCPCATCLDKAEKPPDLFKILSAQELAAGAPAPSKMLPRGHYAYQIVWNDGHDTGIYSLNLLRDLSNPLPAVEKEN